MNTHCLKKVNWPPSDAVKCFRSDFECIQTATHGRVNVVDSQDVIDAMNFASKACGSVHRLYTKKMFCFGGPGSFPRQEQASKYLPLITQFPRRIIHTFTHTHAHTYTHTHTHTHRVRKKASQAQECESFVNNTTLTVANYFLLLLHKLLPQV